MFCAASDFNLVFSEYLNTSHEVVMSGSSCGNPFFANEFRYTGPTDGFPSSPALPLSTLTVWFAMILQISRQPNQEETARCTYITSGKQESKRKYNPINRWSANPSCLRLQFSLSYFQSSVVSAKSKTMLTRQTNNPTILTKQTTWGVKRWAHSHTKKKPAN